VVLVEICSAGGGSVDVELDRTWNAGELFTGARLRTTDAGGVGRFATGEFNACTKPLTISRGCAGVETCRAGSVFAAVDAVGVVAAAAAAIFEEALELARLA